MVLLESVCVCVCVCVYVCVCVCDSLIYFPLRLHSSLQQYDNVAWPLNQVNLFTSRNSRTGIVFSL